MKFHTFYLLKALLRGVARTSYNRTHSKMEVKMKPAGKHVAMLVDNYFEQSEFEEPLKALKNEGVLVTVLTTNDKKSLQAMQHAKLGSKFQADLLLKDSKPEEYDALVLPGGVINADKLRMDEAARSWATDFLDSGRLVAAICHAPWLLVSADLIEERRLTSYYTLQDDVRNAGAEWIDQPVIIDENLITSRQPDDLPKFNAAILEWLETSNKQ
jgi:protease I